VGFLKLYLEPEIIKQAAMTFYNPSSTYDQVEMAGKMCFLKWYKAPKRQTSLNRYRFQSFTRSVANMKPEISSPTSNRECSQTAFPAHLPPSAAVARERAAPPRMGVEMCRRHPGAKWKIH